uniref:Thiol-disulfide isomerase n=1 Tax=uncultured bacterium W5-77b TaxID=1131000 RepID=H9BWF7_9BACT|nr:thiol-disulfide isomerase [uncultured bacterium W5-77b]
MKRTLLFAILTLLFSTYFAWGEEKENIHWMTNYVEATTQAKETNKPLLLYFTGSDWCPTCISFDREILSKKEFSEKAGDSFIFVTVDLPRKKVLPPELVAQNEQLREKFNINGFPTIVLLNKDEERVADLGYFETSASNYATHLLQVAEKNHAF